MFENQVLIAIDLETTGKYPLDAEICEIALIKFQGEKVLEKWTSLIKPTSKMSESVIKIHHITNEMVEQAPSIEDVIKEVHAFVDGFSLVAHNLPFDLGFLCWEFEKNGLSLMNQRHFCTSLLSLELKPKLTSHRLKFLASHFGLHEEPNHRAEQDALTCMKVFNKLSEEVESLEKLHEAQKDDLMLESFSVLRLEKQKPYESMVKAVREKKKFELMYSKGSKKNKWRVLEPNGLVLKTKEESFLVARDEGDTQTKRFMLNKIVDTRI